MTPAEAPIRDAASVLVWRPGPAGPEVLMGRRGTEAAFMPAMRVFPGGAVDPGDAEVPLAAPLAPDCARRLGIEAAPGLAPALAAAAIRELWEETALRLAVPGPWPDPPAAWADFAAGGHRPAAGALTFLFRAVTPPGRPRRFDARFFLVPAAATLGDRERPAGASDELRDLAWLPLLGPRPDDVPFITEVVLAEARAALRRGALPPAGVPFFDTRGREPGFRRLR